MIGTAVYNYVTNIADQITTRIDSAARRLIIMVSQLQKL
jgi:hypothetical protein